MPRKSTSSGPAVSGLEDHLGYWLRLVSNHVSHGFRRRVEATGVTVSEWVMLRELYRLGRCSPGDLVREMGLSKGAISKLIDRLAGKGLVTRTELEADRRHHEVELTATGRALVPRLAQLADENDRQFFGHLSPADRGALLRAMRGIVEHHAIKGAALD
jgi:DNA-binding MarR family transcriptional regulator